MIARLLDGHGLLSRKRTNVVSLQSLESSEQSSIENDENFRGKNKSKMKIRRVEDTIIRFKSLLLFKYDIFLTSFEILAVIVCCLNVRMCKSHD